METIYWIWNTVTYQDLGFFRDRAQAEAKAAELGDEFGVRAVRTRAKATAPGWG